MVCTKKIADEWQIKEKEHFAVRVEEKQEISHIDVKGKKSTIAGKEDEDMIFIPSGEFSMGCVPGDDKCNENEKPMHSVNLDSYFIDRHEVTIGEYKKCVDSGVCSDEHVDDAGCTWTKSGRDKNPVECVNWWQAKSYCNWKGNRLPTEAEWEKAARGTDERIYPWGGTYVDCDYANMIDPWRGIGCSQDSTWPVCSKPKGNSPYGLCDMAGNVWEWVNDYYDESYYWSSPSTNPRGPNTGIYHVIRGGGWNEGDIYMRVSSRHKLDPKGKGGFRCALSIQE